MPAFVVRLLGTPHVEGPDGTLKGGAAQRHRLAVLALLTVAPRHMLARERLMCLLWPEASSTGGRNLLNAAVHSIRRAVGEAALRTQGDALVLDPGQIRLDVVEFEGALAMDDAERAVEIYSGPFLDGFALPDAVEFERWQETERDRLEQLYHEAIERVAESAERERGPAAAARWWRRRLACTPLDGRVALRLMEVLARAGDRAESLKVAAIHSQLLATELGIPPDSDVRALESRIRRESISPQLTTLPTVTPALEERDSADVAYFGTAGSRHGTRHDQDTPPQRKSKPTKRILRMLRTGWLFAGVPAAAFITAAVLWQARATVSNPTIPIPWTVVAEVDGSAPQEMRATVKSLLTTELDASGIARALPESQVRLGLNRMILPDTAALTTAVARELAIRGGVGTIISAALDRVGETYTLAVRIRAADTDSVIATAQAEAAVEDDLISVASIALREALDGAALPIIRRRPNPPMTQSLDAFQKWKLGQRLSNGNEHEFALRAFQDAVALDPAFARAWCSLAGTYYMLGFPDSAEAAFAHTSVRASDLPRFEHLWCEILQSFFRGENHRYYFAALEMAEDFDVNHGNYALALAMLGQLDSAIAYHKTVAARLPFGLPPRELTNRATWLMRAGRYHETAELVRSLPDNIFRNSFEARLATARGNWNEALALATGAIRDDPVSLTIEAGVYSARGRVRDAFEVLTCANDGCLGNPNLVTRTPLDWLEVLLLIAVVGGRVPERVDLTALDTTYTAHATMLRQLWTLHLGSEDSLRISAPLIPEDSSGGSRTESRRRSDDCMERLLQARLLYARAEWSAVLRRLRSVNCSWDDADGRIHHLIEWTLAEAFEKAGQTDSAAVRFADLADYRPADRYFPYLRGVTHSFAHYRAARLFDNLGNSPRAAHHWSAFVESFTTPDPEYATMVEEAKRRIQ